jgi:hypothetical protein
LALFTIPVVVAALQKQVLTISRVVVSLPLRLLDRVFVEYVITWLWVRAGGYYIGYVSS